MKWRILGSLEICGPSGPLVPRSGKRQVLLGMLLLNANTQVSTGQLLDGLWPDRPPSSARANLHSYVADLRRLLVDPATGSRLSTGTDGYQLRVDPGELDVDSFEELARQGRHAIVAGAYQTAIERLGRALGLWRGDLLAGMELPASMWPSATRLREMRLAAMEDWIDARLAEQQHADLVPELLTHAERHPLREKLQGQLMLALQRDGRRAEALARFRGFRQRLVDDLGVEPGAALQRLHRQILADATLDAGTPHFDAAEQPPAPPAPNYLPPDAAGFVGRVAQLAILDEVLGDRSRQCGAGAVLAIAGMAGAGKTALAVHWAYRVAPQFPDGQLYVNLRGYASAPPLAPLAALTLFLRALGVPPSRVPIDLDEAVGLYRTLLAHRRVLLILDNAREADQVRPLLPGGPACVTVVTSRDRLTGLVARDNARRLNLDLLSPDESVAVLRHVLGEGPDDDLRLPQLQSLADACGHLPLALLIAAANVADQPGQDIAGYVRALTAEDRLGRLAVAGDPHASVRAAFAMSYRILAPAAQRLFRLIGLIPGMDFTADAAAALGGGQVEDTRRLLDLLAGAHLVEPHPGGRYAVHDLLREYARDEADRTDGDRDRTAAVDRLCDFYLGGVDAAASLLFSHTVRIPARHDRPGAAWTAFADAGAAREWLDAELSNLAALTHRAAHQGPRRAAWLLADGLRGYFWIRRPVAEWLATGDDGLAAASADGDRHALAAMHLTLGLARRSIGDLSRAHEHLQEALRTSRAARWPEGQASALGNIAVAHAEAGDNQRAIDMLDEALALNRALGRRGSEAVVLGNLGAVRLHLGDLRRSRQDATAALRLYRETGNLSGEATALSNLGIIAVYLGHRDRALAHLTAGQRLYEQIGDRFGFALGGYGFAKLHSEAGDHRRALPHAAAAVELARDAGKPDLAIICAVDLAIIRQRLGEEPDAAAQCAAACAAARAAQATYAEVWTLIGLARAIMFGGRDASALPRAREALVLARCFGYRLLEGEALNTVSALEAATGDLVAATRSAQEAVGCLAETGYRRGEQQARCLLQQAQAALGHGLTPTASPPAIAGPTAPVQTTRRGRQGG